MVTAKQIEMLPSNEVLPVQQKVPALQALIQNLSSITQIS